MEKNHGRLKRTLDESEPHQVLVNKRCLTEMIKKDNGIYVRDIDPVLSVLSTSYELIKAYPDRFCQRHPSGPIEYTWNIHHEDWIRAHVVIVTRRKDSST